MKKIIPLVLILISQFCFSQTNDNRGYKVNVGEYAPKIDLALLDGTRITNENLKGKVVVLQFTASWCVVCIKEMPHLEKEVWQQYKNDDFLLVGVDLKEEKEKVERFIKKTGITYPVALDSDGALFESITLPKAGVTRNVVLDKNGKIIFLTRLFEENEFNKMIAVIDAELKKGS